MALDRIHRRRRDDRQHPGAALVADACFYAGLRRRAEGRGGEPHRPAANFSYMQNDAFEPAFIVDVTATWAKKELSLAAYSSQLYGPGSAARAEPATKVASREFARGVEGRARHFGVLIGVEFGEPYWSRLPLAVADLRAIVPRGLR